MINASEGERDQPDRSHLFSVNTNRQAVTWKAGQHASNVTPVPEHLQPFFRQLTNTVHDIAAKRAEALEMQRKREEEAREEAKKYYEANKEKIDAERALKRKKMDEEAIEAQAKKVERELKEKLSCRQAELNHALRVMNWKASMALQPASLADETEPTEADKMLESAKRGPKHDFCEECGDTLRFCVQEGCTIIGCHECFEDELTVCTSCTGVFCAQHDVDLNTCSSCENIICKSCDGQTCPSCENFVCNDCSECSCGISLNEDDYLYGGDFDFD